MQQIILIIHVVVAIALVGLVLLQQGKGAEVGAAFGSGASQTVFGSQGSSSFLFKLTAGLAAIFLLTSLVLTRMAAMDYHHQDNGSVISQTLPQTTNTDNNVVPLPGNNKTSPLPTKQQ